MSLLTRHYLVAVIAVLSVLGGWGLAMGPAQANDSTATGIVSSSNGPVDRGFVYFYATCQDYESNRVADRGFFSDGDPYEVSVPDGTYRVFISPFGGSGALGAWHSAKPTCEESNAITVSGNSVINLVTTAGSDVIGTVSSSNGPVMRGEVYFYTSCKAYENVFNGVTASAYVEDGRYVVTVPDGSYLVRIEPDEATGALASWHSAESRCDQATEITVSGDTTADVVAIAGANLTGSISSANGPIAGATIEFFASCQDYQDQRPTVETWVYNGRPYTVTLPKGDYRVRISPASGYGAGASWHNAKRTCSEATLLSVAGNATVDLVAMTGAEVRGTVSSSNGQVNEGRVEFYASCEDYTNYTPTGSSYFSDGRPYSVAVPDGTYRVRIRPRNGNGALDSWHSNKPSCDDAVLVNVNGDATVNLTATAGSDVTGTVSTSGGPLDSGNVDFYASCQDEEEGDSAASGSFDDEEPYIVTVPNGTYRVSIHSSESDPTTSWHRDKLTCEEATIVTITGRTVLNLVASDSGDPEPTPTPTPAPTRTPTATPSPTSMPTTDPTPATAKQSAKKPSAKLKRGRSMKLAKRTSQGAKLTWKAKTKKVCKVKKHSLKAGTQRGKCVVAASAPSLTGYYAFSGTFVIRVK